MSALNDFVLRASIAMENAPTPTPMPAYTGDPNLITPGVIGFIAMFLVAAVTVLLIVDMNRRIRRTKYRVEVRERLEEERDAQNSTPG
ncbi:hypothetical protein B0I08_1115 [Glaciihabitans tibetensis]|uniref:Uncharacterized protein n=1 Tax=Glaciihabitans tibetensis TaxID=1266600 RepID=A0A2T0V4K4_9MICO|nr:hypothetical protein [Glaciihabitans tibetensis]PRY64988.1 hypothetical protein B0I08_1115 [Glaciihabitans tibetensis]